MQEGGGHCGAAIVFTNMETFNVQETCDAVMKLGNTVWHFWLGEIGKRKIYCAYFYYPPCPSYRMPNGIHLPVYMRI